MTTVDIQAPGLEGEEDESGGCEPGGTRVLPETRRIVEGGQTGRHPSWGTVGAPRQASCSQHTHGAHISPVVAEAAPQTAPSLGGRWGEAAPPWLQVSRSAGVLSASLCPPVHLWRQPEQLRPQPAVHDRLGEAVEDAGLSCGPRDSESISLGQGDSVQESACDTGHLGEALGFLGKDQGHSCPSAPATPHGMGISMDE